MALSLLGQNRCSFGGCQQYFASTDDLIAHIEFTHIREFSLAQFKLGDALLHNLVWHKVTVTRTGISRVISLDVCRRWFMQFCLTHLEVHRVDIMERSSLDSFQPHWKRSTARSLTKHSPAPRRIAPRQLRTCRLAAFTGF